MYPIVAEKYMFVVGVDTHARKHVASVINNIGVVIARREFRVLSTDINKFIDWSLKIVQGEEVLFAIEGTSSYGETLTNALLARSLSVVEVRPPITKSRGGDGKTDQIDSELAARGVLRLPINELITPRTGDNRKLLRVLLGGRRLMITQQTMNKNALIALLRGSELGVDARMSLAYTDYQTIADWKIRKSDELQYIKTEARRLARSVLAVYDELVANKIALYGIVSTLAPDLLELPGVGPITLAQVICSYSHKGRIHSAEAFAALAGTTPIPASSGNTSHYRLNHYGDRQLNHALTTIVLCRMRTDEITKRYVMKRTRDGLGIRDIKRSLKRYLARSLFKQLEACNITT